MPLGSHEAGIVVRTPLREIPLRIAGDLARAAMQWTYVVRNRSRWSASSDRTQKQTEQATELLGQLGVGPQELRHLAEAGTVEVAIPWQGDEELGWEARILPWETLIGVATRPLRDHRALMVVRRLVAPARGPTGPPTQPRVLFVTAAPRPLDQYFDFTTERELVRARLAATDAHWRELESPTRDELGSTVSTFKPHIIHVTGFDTHLALRVLAEIDAAAAKELSRQARGDDDETREIRDGLVLRSSGGDLDPVDGDALAPLLTASHRPNLVSLATWNSAARLAPLTIAHGARAALGFQDTFDDDLAELLYSRLYATLSRSGWSLLQAFRDAWDTVREASSKLQGTGVVLWSSDTLLPRSTRAAAGTARRRRERLAAHLEHEESREILPERVKSADVSKWITVNVKPVSDFNYALIHNGQPLFEHFSLTAQQTATLRDVQIKVVLSAGAESASFERILQVNTRTRDQREDIHVPLTSELTRSVHESVRTSMFVEICWGKHVLFRDSFKMRLVPVDQWRDTRVDGLWLPSFVFPRDAAVHSLVSVAQRYVQVLRDDPSAGFDGYQSYDPANPASASEVDLQVQAIWAAMVHELRLGYINPPPAYSRDLDSQRLRTPSMVARERSGTCIDLALFFSACLELVDIYPVLFLLTGHAFPGYWRSDSDHDAFREARPESIREIAPADSRASAAALAQQKPWYLGSSAYREIVDHVRKGRLVPLETVRLTEHCGFWEAMDAGRQNLRAASDFECLIDLKSARTAAVTPLPLWGEQA